MIELENQATCRCKENDAGIERDPRAPAKKFSIFAIAGFASLVDLNIFLSFSGSFRQYPLAKPPAWIKKWKNFPSTEINLISCRRRPRF